jgi:sterol desaturase/sphingolipid hydroxylase (fatty acid hydroxylase superfamily)
MIVYHSVSWWWIPGFALGWFAWTFNEYLTHRFMLHDFFFFRNMHDLHHDDSNECTGTPPIITLSAYIISLLLFGFHSSIIVVGWYVGFLTFIYLHAKTHTWQYSKLRTEWARKLKVRHMLHHKFPQTNYGVTLALWDELFGTEKKR